LQHGELGHRIGGVRGVDLDRVGEVAHPDAALGELVDEVKGVADGAAEPVQGVHHDHVAVAGVLQRRLQPGPVGRGTGLLVQVDPLRRDPGLMQRVDLPVQVLLGGRDPRVSQLHPRTVPEVLLVRLLQESVVGLTCGTPACAHVPHDCDLQRYATRFSQRLPGTVTAYARHRRSCPVAIGYRDRSSEQCACPHRRVQLCGELDPAGPIAA